MEMRIPWSKENTMHLVICWAFYHKLNVADIIGMEDGSLGMLRIDSDETVDLGGFI